jgi:hypothetical protein
LKGPFGREQLKLYVSSIVMGKVETTSYAKIVPQNDDDSQSNTRNIE